MMNKTLFSIFKEGSKTYFYSSIFFPTYIKKDVFSLYGFVRKADNFVDSIPQDINGFYEFKDKYYDAINGKKTDDIVIDSFVNLMNKKDFDVIITGDDYACSKPHPEPYLMALKALGFAAEKCIAVEDSEIGLASASAARIPCVVVPTEMTRNFSFAGALAVEQDVLKLLYEHGNKADSISDIIRWSGYLAASSTLRNRFSRIINRLELKGFVDADKGSKMKVIRLTDFGVIFAEALSDLTKV